MLKTSMKRDLDQIKKRASEHPEEWDFRKVTEDILHLAITYEYAREANRVVEDIKKWQRKRLRLPKGVDGFRKWNGRTVLDAISSGETLPSEIDRCIGELQPEHFGGSPFAELLEICPLFPKAFLLVKEHVSGVREMGLLDHLVPSWQRKIKSFQVLQTLPAFSERRIKLDEKTGILNLAVRVDLRAGKTQLQKDASLALSKIFDEHPSSKRLPKGKAAVIPWHHLRELAAYRLNKMGLNGETGPQFVESYHSKNLQLKDTNDVLPKYSRNGWFKAVSIVRERIKDL